MGHQDFARAYCQRIYDVVANLIGLEYNINIKIKIIKEKITLTEAKEIGKEFYDEMVKGAVDIDREIFALGGEYHIDAGNVLIEDGSKQSDIWGFNIVFTKDGGYFLEYTAMINIKPAAGNRDMEIHNEEIRSKIEKIVESKIA